MSQNLQDIFTKAANSNLTATAVEFVPRTSSSHSEQSTADMDNGMLTLAFMMKFVRRNDYFFV